eukprot:gene11277-biopygen6820
MPLVVPGRILCNSERVPEPNRPFSIRLQRLPAASAALPGLEVLAVGVHDHRDREHQAGRELHAVDDAVVRVLVHEPLKGGEAAVGEQLDVARLALRQRDRPAVRLLHQVRGRARRPRGAGSPGMDFQGAHNTRDRELPASIEPFRFRRCQTRAVPRSAASFGSVTIRSTSTPPAWPPAQFSSVM